MEYLTPTHQEILDILNQINVEIIVDNHPICESRKFDGYVMSPVDHRNPTNRTQFLMCNSVIKTNYDDWQGEINRTLAHEALHVAQFCKSGDGYARPLGFRNDVEKEAFAVQDQPREVLRILKKYCL